MNNGLTLTTLRHLAVASLIALLLFLIFWNFENYKRIKEELKQNLTTHMELACSQYRDSVVQVIFRTVETVSSSRNVTHFPEELFFQPLTTEKPNWHNNIGLKIDSIQNDSGVHSLRVIFFDSLRTEKKPEREIVAWTNGNSGKFNLEFQKDTVTDSLVIIKQATSLITQQRADSSMQIPATFRIIDTLFREQLQVNSLPLEYQIVKKEVVNKQKMNIPFAYASMGFGESPVATFSNTSGYILSQMIFPVLASVFLFSLLAISFGLVFRNIAAQRKLTTIKNEFISNMTHELKTPISTVGVAIEALENFGASDDPNKRKEYIDICKHEVTRLSSLVNKVMRLSFNDQSAQKLTMSELDIHNILNETVSNMKPLFEKKRIQYEQHINDGAYNINGDKLHLTNVIYNILDNAIKYSPKGSNVDVSLTCNPRNVQIRIQDEGIGIPKEYHSKIFDRFFRVPADNLHDVKGHGLGLHYVRSIVEGHKGKIRMESDGKIGTSFIIDLPR